VPSTTIKRISIIIIQHHPPSYPRSTRRDDDAIDDVDRGRRSRTCGRSIAGAHRWDGRAIDGRACWGVLAWS
jgi:hypothetical protein